MQRGGEFKGSPLLLVSDLDDTIKISHTQSRLVTVYRGLFRSSAFAGMAVLYREILSAHPESSFLIISSSPPAIRRRIESFLVLNGFPKAKIVLRDWIRETSIERYKKKALLEAVRASAHPVLLVGDDTEHDPEVLAHVSRELPGKVLARYIRAVKGRELPAGTVPFYTAFDIACAELSAGRLPGDSVLKVGEALLQAEKMSRLIPWFSLKPPLQLAPLLIHPDEAILELWQKIQTKIESIPRGKRKK